ncbi:hypothetical protein FCU45_00380 [Sulfurimonas crateris]|uniref:Diguanylate cyclase n=1 Tax=Sulfurimonas crateris TaxID=2574727 RepID=A0A4U2ZB51_9BACT|nr:hypothetical protein [Sulfurimonas crateris]TKI70882.1 hypothetical protein FCU45_00380 [Sulfurimonas crateris]
MAGIHFGFDNFRQLLDLSIGLAERLDENRAESFTLLYCDFSSVEASVIKSSLEHILRNSDAIVHSESDYFFLLPYTDKYGARIVKDMFEEFFARDLNNSMVSYPVDGESSRTLVEELANNISTTYKKDLKCLGDFNLY